MSFTTRPPGDVVRGPGAVTPPSPAAATPGAVGGGALPLGAAAGATVNPPPARAAVPDAASALRVFVEEVRAGVQAQSQASTRVPASPPLPDSDPGNAAAALLRWLRSAARGVALPSSSLPEIVERAYAQAESALQRAAAPNEGAPAAQRAQLATVADVLAASRDLVLRGLGTDVRRGSLVAEAARGTDPSTERGPAARAPVDPRASAPSGTPHAPSPARPDPVTVLRALVDDVRARLRDGVGPGRLPSAPPPIVTDAHGSSLGPALVRWLTSALAEKGAPLAALQDAVRGAFARAEAALAEAGGPSPEAGEVARLRDALAAIREHVLRGLGVPPERDGAPAPRDAGAPPRIEARADAGVPDPRGVALAGGAVAVARGDDDERVDPVDRRGRPPVRADADEEDAGGEPADARVDEALQGPMDCVRRYFEAYLAGDSHAYAAQWVYPACVWSGGRWSSYADAAACAAGNDRYTAEWRAQGVVGGRIVMLRVEPVADDVALVHGVFTRERADGSVHSETEAAYTTVRTAQGWRVAVCMVRTAGAA